MSRHKQHWPPTTSSGHSKPRRNRQTNRRQTQEPRNLVDEQTHMCFPTGPQLDKQWPQKMQIATLHIIQHNQINEYPWLPVLTHYIQWYSHTLIPKATLSSLKDFSQLFDRITATTQLPIHTLVIKGNITSLSCMRNQILATLSNVHAKVSMTIHNSSSQPLQPGNSINQIISQIIQRDRSATDNQVSRYFWRRPATIHQPHQ